MDIETSLVAAEQFETAPVVSARQLRNRRYYEKKRLKASETSEIKTPKTLKTVSDAVKTVSDAAPRAHVRDITSNSENNLQSVVVVLGAGERSEDDWPTGDLFMLLAEAAESPRLDPAKNPKLVQTAGLIGGWRRAGASWQHDVLPVVTSISRQRGPPIGTWKYFDAAVLQSVADNRRALEIPEARNDPANPRRQPTARDDRISRMLAGAMAAVDEQQPVRAGDQRAGGG